MAFRLARAHRLLTYSQDFKKTCLEKVELTLPTHIILLCSLHFVLFLAFQSALY